jgi:hypothetical protein
MEISWDSNQLYQAQNSDAKTLALFAEYLGQHSKTREDIKTWFEAIELDDYASFGGKP